MSNSQGKHLGLTELARIFLLLRESEMTLAEIATTMNRSRSTITAVNRRVQIRHYGGMRNRWVVDRSSAQLAPDRFPVNEDPQTQNLEAAQMEDSIGAWEEDGGSPEQPPKNRLTGTANQIECAENIRTRVDAEFDRVSRVLQTAALKQSAPERSDTHAMIGILEQKRAEVMEHEKAGYFIHDWQEMRDQVRTMIMHDMRYKAIKARSQT